MILCLVTDRRRLGAAVGAQESDWVAVLRNQVAAAASAGVDFIQVREPDLEARELTDLVRSLVRIAASTPARILVNDRIDVALATGAAGVHLKEQSILPSDVRRIAPRDFVIGCSVHGIDAIAARKSADFLIAGTVMPTASKPAVDYLNRVGLSRIVEAAAEQPVLGIGGLDLPSIPLLASTGAAGLAAIGAFIPAAGTDVSENVQNRVKAMRFAFDSARRHT
jgi:thiamine-phosphate pyrophosphorylase